MKQKFKKGDTVEVIHNSFNGHDIGVIGTVEDIEYDKVNHNYCYDIKDIAFPNFNSLYWHKETDLILKK